MKKIYIFIVLCSLYVMTQPNMLLDLGVQLGAQQGASSADDMINDVFTDIGKTVSNDMKTLGNNSKEFSPEIQKAESSNFKSAIQVFSTAQNSIKNNQSTVEKNTQILGQYLQKAASFPQTKDTYLLAGAVNLDLLFTLGTMYTPQGPIWKNIFTIGNWQYEHSTDSFWQMSLEDLLATTTDPNDTSGKKSAVHASQNSIFTEYFTQETSYEIQCDLTVYQVTYPFFAGIIFNQTRWISGNPDSLAKCRLFGIYADSETSITNYFAEQYELSESAFKAAQAKSKNAQPILYPLPQIMNGQAKKVTASTTYDFSKIQKKPQTFTIRILNSATKIGLKIWPKNTNEPASFQYLQSNDPNLYLFHNLGFMSPGAITEFKIIKPTNLLFSSKAKQTFTSEVEALHPATSKKGSS